MSICRKIKFKFFYAKKWQNKNKKIQHTIIEK